MSAADALKMVGDTAAVCTACGLAETRTQVVFGAGAPDADLMFVGEAPGRNEDLQGEPFVGAAGNLLERLLGEIGIGRDDVYIANVLKCRPPGNRDPKPEEIDACKGYLRSQLELVDPRVVVTLGNFANEAPRGHFSVGAALFQQCEAYLPPEALAERNPQLIGALESSGVG